MDQQALEGLGSFASAADRDRALAYFEQLKQSDNGWKLCAEAITQGVYENDHIKFFCFQVLEHFINERYATADPSDQQLLKQTLMTWLHVQTVSSQEEKSFVRNKAAQLFSLMFIHDFPHKWPTFFSDLLQMLQVGQAAVDMYLRVLLAIDSEVVDREIIHTAEETMRNSLLKDEMRERCIKELVDSWFHILKNYESSNPELACLCLEVVGVYVSWVDINLIANERFVGLLLHHLSIDVLRESACDCFHEIIEKGMDPVAKTELVESVTKVLQDSGVIPPTGEEDIDFVAKLSKLTNGIGCNLIAAWQKLVKSKNTVGAVNTLQAIESKLPLMFMFLGHEDDDISLAVCEFAKDYVGILKQIGTLNEGQMAYFQRLLLILLDKFRYDETYNFDSQGEDEIMFLDYRRQLKVLFDNLAQLNQSLVLTSVHSIVMETLGQWRNKKFIDAELAVRLLYMLGEAIPAKEGNHFEGESSKTELLKDMMRTLVSSGVVGHSHWAVTLQVYETVVRYERFFNQEPQHIPGILVAFLDNRGLRHPHPTVRSRSAYLFTRFIKSLKHHMRPFTEEILTRIQDLLIIVMPENGHPPSLTTDDQLFLYEVAGVIITSSAFDSDKKQLLMRNVLAPIIDKFNTLYPKLCTETDEQRQVVLSEIIAHAIACTSRTSKAFHSQLTIKQCGCESCYTEALDVFLRALDVPHQHGTVHAAVRQYLHRMVVCLEEAVLPYVPVAVEHLLKKSEARDLHKFMPLINQIISKFKKTIIRFLQAVFMPIVRTIDSVLKQPTEETDTQAAIDKQTLRRCYFQFLQCIAMNDCLEVISHQEQPSFEEVLLSVVRATIEEPDPVMIKTCFNILKRLIESWGGNGGMPLFREFIYKYVIPACFLAPLQKSFDLTDAQTVMALAEASTVLKSIYTKDGLNLVQFLQTECFMSLPVRVDTDSAQAFCQALQEMDVKNFKSFCKVFFESAKKSAVAS
ncbi:exportin-T-like [Diadema setosum]|uniref:exportin-T-like n=1 Tax=Diadema setosum TaxID=31175 RepID=UPI003B3AB2BA